MDGNPASADPPVVRVSRQLRAEAAARLVATPGVDPSEAGLRFLKRAREHGIALDLFWAVLDGLGRVRQSALVVPQAGRTAMLFLSGIGEEARYGGREEQFGERVAVIRGAIRGTTDALGDGVHLVQSLPAPEEWWAVEAFQGAGMLRLGDLAYLRRPLRSPAGAGIASPAWPEGVEVVPMTSLDDPDARRTLREALERTYIDTLDCPGLCEMRETDDVIDSHRATGEADPSLWWIVFLNGWPEGCVLLSPCPDQDSVELVYMGLGPGLRGRGLAAGLLARAIERAQRTRLSHVVCAVDEKNEPARALYARLGFSAYAHRIAFVRGTRRVD
jgi:RimJ/RimL family protein N-acetyltransferase